MQKINRVGEKHVTNQGYTAEIIEYFNKRKCTIKLENSLIIEGVAYDNLKRGKINNPYHKSVFNIGYLGDGEYIATINRKSTKTHSKWRSAIQRCYNENEHKRNPTYKECTIVEEWHNFQNFAKWFEENYNPEYMEGWELDKDILFKGNKIYSPETCCFVPKEINYILLKSNSKRGKYPIGVHFDKERLKYTAQLNIKNLGRFETIEEAFQSYKEAKEEYIKEVANKWKGQITEACYQALINYKVEITD